MRWLMIAAVAAAILAGRMAVAQPSASSGPGSVVALTPLNARNSARAVEEAAGTEVIDGLELSVWAPPGLVANPLTLDLAADGTAYVITSSRAGLLLDIRQHPDWVPEVHSLRSTEDLRAFFRRVMAPERSAENGWLTDFNGDGSHDYRDLTVVAERVFRIEDADGDGVAERSGVVYEGFNDDIASDIAGGILLQNEDLYVTAAPDLWRLRDTTGDGLFDEALSLSHGYSTHPAFSGHDMSALAMGPDGRLYWKIGDIGLNVVDADGRRWEYPNQGAVLRADPDGSNFEVFATGLRNTQEIAFDAHGNLVSVDNDGDHAGETERVVYIVQGSDAGWRSTWQYGKYTDSANNAYNVWMQEGLFRPHFEGQAAYITPPIAAYHAGPSGFAFNPGTALSDRWDDYFFISSFTGTAASASIYAFQLEPEGAGFRLANDTRVVSGLLSAGIAFGPDGTLYLTDWVRGWGATGEGQLWKLDAPAAEADAVRPEVQTLLNDDFSGFGRRDLRDLLAHADMRIRQKAQFELVAREDWRTLATAADRSASRLARLHALWGLGQLARADISHADSIRPYLDDPDPEVRAQAAKLLGDARDPESIDALIPRLADEADRVRFFAAEALGRIAAETAIEPIAEMLAANDGRDVYLRTAGIHALASIGNAEAIAALASNDSAAVRIAAVVALRRLRDPLVAGFITDSDPAVVTEAARAINDEGGIAEALPALAAALAGPVRGEPFVRRAISANLRVGDLRSARRLVDFAARDVESAGLRVEAVEALGVWAEPSRLDRVDGAWLGEPGTREVAPASLAAADLLPLLDQTQSDPALRVAILESAAVLDVDGVSAAALARLENDPETSVRLAAQNVLSELGGPDAELAIGLSLADAEVEIRMAAIEAMPQMSVADAVRVAELGAVVDSAETAMAERQSAITALGNIDSPLAVTSLRNLLDTLAAGELPAALQLELVEAADATGDVDLAAGLETLGLDGSSEALARALPAALASGGSAERGRQIATRHPAAQCTRCHTLAESVSEVGPPLDGIGAKYTPAELLVAVIDPAATVAPGFGAESAGAMPPMGAILGSREIRDVVAFLAALR